MLENIKYKIKKTIIGIYILKIKFFLNFGLEKEAKYLKKNFKFTNSADVGSNAGYYSNMLIKISNKVFSFEPIKYHCINQKKIFKKMNVKILNLGLGNKRDKKRLFIPRNNDPEASFINKRKNFDSTFVNLERGDYVFGNKKIDFIKIDVEGYELDVLRGLKSQIKNFKPLLLVEIEKRHNKNYLKVFKFLNNYNYNVYYLTEKNKLEEIPIKSIDRFIKNRQKFKLINSERYINNFFFK